MTIESTRDFVIHLHSLGGWAYLVLAVMVMLEGPVTTVLAAAAAAQGWLRPSLVLICACAGNLCGDLIWYSLGRLAPLPWLLRHGPWLGLRTNALPHLLRQVHWQCRTATFSAKLTQVLATAAFVSLGVARVPLRRWFSVDVAAECLCTGTLVLSGTHLVKWLTWLQR